MVSHNVVSIMMMCYNDHITNEEVTNMNTAIQTIVNAVVDTKSVEQVLTLTGLSKPQLFGHMASMKKHGLVSYEDGNLVLTEEGKKLVEHQPETAHDAVTQVGATPVLNVAPSVVAVKKVTGPREQRTDTKKFVAENLLATNTTLSRKLKITMLMEHASMTYNGANTYIYNYDKKQKTLRKAATA